jgi:hypothetical protein
MTHSRKSKLRIYVLYDRKTGKLREKKVKAYNYIEASKKMKVTPYELRTYGYIEKVKN